MVTAKIFITVTLDTPFLQISSSKFIQESFEHYKFHCKKQKFLSGSTHNS